MLAHVSNYSFLQTRFCLQPILTVTSSRLDYLPLPRTLLKRSRFTYSSVQLHRNWFALLAPFCPQRLVQYRLHIILEAVSNYSCHNCARTMSGVDRRASVDSGSVTAAGAYAIKQVVLSIADPLIVWCSWVAGYISGGMITQGLLQLECP